MIFPLLHIGYIPIQSNASFDFSDDDLLMYTKNGSCDYENFYYEHYIGHHQQQYGNAKISVYDQKALSRVLNDKGFEKLEQFLAGRYLFPIKAVWEYMELVDSVFDKISISLVENEGKSILKIQKEAIEKIIPIEAFEAFYQENYDTYFKCFSKEIREEISKVSNYFGYDFPFFDLRPTENVYFIFGDQQHRRQLNLALNRQRINVFAWNTTWNDDVSEAQVELPMNIDTYTLAIGEDYMLSSIYDEVKSLLEEVLKTQEIYLPRKEKITESIDDTDDHGESSRKDSTVVHERAEPNFEPAKVDVHTYTFDAIPINDDIHLFKKIGKEVKFGSQHDAIFPELKATNYVVIPASNDQGEAFYIFRDKVYINNEDNQGREVVGLPNEVMSHRYKISRIFESKTKVLLICQLNEGLAEHLFLINKTTGELESRKF